MASEQRLAQAVFATLVRGAINKRNPDAIEPFDPEGEDEYVDIEWHDAVLGRFRSARIGIELED